MRVEREPGVMERVVEALEDYRRLVEDERAFTREIMRRNEKVVADLMWRGGENSREVAEIKEELGRLSEESQAQQKGLFAVIDRLPPPERS